MRASVTTGLLLCLLLCACNEDGALGVAPVGPRGDGATAGGGDGAGGGLDDAGSVTPGDPNRFLGNGCRASDPEANAPWPTAAQGRARRNRAAVAGPRRANRLFAQDLGGGWLSAPVVATDGTVAIGTFDGHVHVLDGRTGARKWSAQLLGSVGGLTIGCGGELFVSSPPRIVSFDLRSGTRRFDVPVGSVAILNPGLTISGDILFVGTNSNTVLALDTRSGAVRWSYKGDSTFAPTAAVGLDGTLYVGSGGGRVHALDGQTGALRWRSDDLGPILGYPVLRSEEELVVLTQRGLYRVATRDGASSRFDGDPPRAPPSIDEGVVFTGTDVSATLEPGGVDSRVFLGNVGATLRVQARWDSKVSWEINDGTRLNQSPVIGADGIVYLTTFEGVLMAYGP